MTRVLRDNNGVQKVAKKSMKKMKINKESVIKLEIKEIKMIMDLSKMIENLEKQCLQHGLQKQLLNIQRKLSTK